MGGSSALQPLPGSAVCQELALRAFDRASNASQLSRRLQATSLASALLGIPFPCWTLATCPSPMSASPSPHIPSLHVPGPPAAGSRGLPNRAAVHSLSAICSLQGTAGVSTCPWPAVLTAGPSPPQGLGVPWPPAWPESRGSAQQPGPPTVRPCHATCACPVCGLGLRPESGQLV